MEKTKFDLSNEVKTSFDLGKLVPVFWQEVMPGDSFRVSHNCLIRLQPLLAPSMHALLVYVNSYYVPYRLLQSTFKDMISKPDSPLTVDKLAKYIKPAEKQTAFKQDNLLRAFGITIPDRSDIPDSLCNAISAYPFLAYQLIYNYYYRDVLLDTAYKDDFRPENFAELDSIIKLRNVNWHKDYYTSAFNDTEYGTAVDIDMDGNKTVKVDELTTAVRLQRFKEMLLKAGTRYVDFITRFFGVRPSDESLQRPLHLGGNAFKLNINDVEQTTMSEIMPLGGVAGKSVTSNSNFGFEREFNEHGIILTLVHVMPRQSYLAGVDRSFLHDDWLDFPIPHFAHLGMQELKRIELDSSANPNEVFGYSPRYDHLRYGRDVVAGDFRTSLKFWHFSRDLRDETLSAKFLECHPRRDPFAVTATMSGSTDVYWQQVGLYNSAGTLQESKVLISDLDSINRWIVKYSPSGWRIKSSPRKLTKNYLYYRAISGKMVVEENDIIPSDVNESMYSIYSKLDGYINIIANNSNSIYSDVAAAHVVFVYPDYIQQSPNLISASFSFHDYFNNDFSVNNLVLAVFYNEVSALRPIPRYSNPSLM